MRRFHANKGLDKYVTRPVPPDENGLIQRSIKGDAKAYDILVRRYERPMLQLGIRLTGNVDDGADIAQEAFIRGWNHLKAFRGDAMFSTWMHRIVVNVFLDHRKRHKNRVFISLDQAIDTEESSVQRELPDLSPGPEQLLLDSAQQIALQQALLSLPETQRTLMVLFHIQDRTYEEIVTITDLPLGTVKSRLNRARLALRDRVDQNIRER